MTTGAAQIAAENQRRRIPDKFLIMFNELTDDELAWISNNGITPEYRAYAGWELEYREAFGFEVFMDPETAELKRRKV